MDAENYTDLLPLLLLGGVFFLASALALYWSAKNGQLKNFDRQAKTIFTEEEPEGKLSDSFPERKSSK